MLIVISPAKTLDYESPMPSVKPTQPDFLDESASLVEVMRKKKPTQLRKMMGISPKLADLNHDRYLRWDPRHTAKNSRPAVLAFMGDVYGGLDARSLDARELTYAQQHLRILSGLYGLLRPLDRIQPYRLEMGTSVKNPRGRDLYRFWGDRPTQALNEQARKLRTRYLINLASNEYFKAVDRSCLEPTIITPVFKEKKGEQYRVLSFFAKKARGMMARYLICNRVRKPEDMREFKDEGYAYNAALSSDTEFVFTR